MASILQRMRLIVTSNLSDFLKKFEDPEKIIDEILREAKEELADTKVQLAETKGKLNIEIKKVNALKADAESWNTTAMKALKAGNEDDARYSLQKKAAIDNQIKTQESIVENMQFMVSDAEANYNELVDGINNMESKKNEIKSKAAAAEMQKKVNKIVGKDFNTAFSQFDEMASRVDSEFETQKAMAEMRQGEQKDDDIRKKYASPDVDEELEKLKKSMGIE